MGIFGIPSSTLIRATGYASAVLLQEPHLLVLMMQVVISRQEAQVSFLSMLMS